MNNNNNIQVDNTATSPNIGNGTTKGTTKSIIGARDRVESVFSKQTRGILESQKEIDGYALGLENILKQINALGGEYTKQITNQKAYKEVLKTLEDLKNVQAEVGKLVKDQNISAESLNKLYTTQQISLLNAKEASSDILDIHDQSGQALKEQTDEMKLQSSIRKRDSDDTIDALKKQQKETEKLIKESRKSLGDAVKTSVHDMGQSLSNLKKVLDLDKIAAEVERSSRTILQEEIQIAFDIDRGTFGDLKRDINDTYDVSLYTQKEVMATYESLRQLGVDNQEEATEMFSTILKGQSLLGMSVETQAELVGLGNRYNKDMLTFMTTRTAEYMQTATNVGKQQLNELISLNTNLANDLADKGFDDPAVLENLNNATVALTELNSGDDRYAKTYQSALADISSMGIDSVGAMFGMDMNQIREYLGTSGNNLFSLFSNSGSTQMGALLDAVGSGDETTIEALQNGFGISDSVVSLMRYMTELQAEGINIQKEVQRQADGAGDTKALLEAEIERDKNTSWVQEMANGFGSFVSEMSDWATMDSIENSLAVIITLLTAIEATLVLQSLGGLFKGVGKGLNKFAGSSVGQFIGGSGGAISKAVPLVAGGLAVADLAIDGFSGYHTTAESMYGADATTGQRFAGAGISALSGSSVTYTSDGKVDDSMTGFKGAGSGALKGAGIGLLIGGPIGAAIGGSIGLVAGGIAGLYKADKAQEQLLEDQLAELENINENTAATADAAISPTWANRMVSSYRPAYESLYEESGVVGNVGSTSIPSATTGAYNASGNVGSTGFLGNVNQYLGKWRVSSGFGDRAFWRYDPSHPDSVKDSSSPNYGQYLYKDYHTGIDLTAGGGQGIYSVSRGTAQSKYDKYAGNYVQVDDGQHSYVYAHMASTAGFNGQTIEPGTYLGQMGTTGNSTGQHLHFEVKKGGKAVHPVPFLSEIIQNPNVSADKAVDAVEWAKYLMENSLPDEFNGLFTETDNPMSDPTAISTQTLKLKNVGAMNKADPVVAGLSQINNTLVSLANRQTEQEAILQMLSNKGKQNPIMS